MIRKSGKFGKLYNFAKRRQFLKVKHPCFDKRWITVFKWQDKVNENKVKGDIARELDSHNV